MHERVTNFSADGEMEFNVVDLYLDTETGELFIHIPASGQTFCAFGEESDGLPEKRKYLGQINLSVGRWYVQPKDFIEFLDQIRQQLYAIAKDLEAEHGFDPSGSVLWELWDIIRDLDQIIRQARKISI